MTMKEEGVMRWMILVLVACAAVPSFARAGDEESVYDPDSFTISYWCGPPPKFLTAERFAEIREANFTLAFPPCWGMSVADNRKMLDLSHQAGLKAVIHDSRMVHSIGGSAEAKKKLDAIIADYADHPALLGYHIVDEPAAGMKSVVG